MLKRGLKHLSRVSDVLFRKLRIERDITIFPDDVFLTSYPRSGNTWTRFLVGNLLHQEEEVTFLSVERLVPDMYKHSDRVLRTLPRPRIMKSHECFDPRYRKSFTLSVIRETSRFRIITGNSSCDRWRKGTRLRISCRVGCPLSSGLALALGEITWAVGSPPGEGRKASC